MSNGRYVISETEARILRGQIAETAIKFLSIAVDTVPSPDGNTESRAAVVRFEISAPMEVPVEITQSVPLPDGTSIPKNSSEICNIAATALKQRLEKSAAALETFLQS